MEDLDSKLKEYKMAKMYRINTIREYNDIIEEINKDGMDERQKEYLLNKSIKLRNLVDEYSKYAENLKNDLNIPSSEEENDSEEYSSEYSSPSEEESRPYEEESRPSSPSEEGPRPSKRPKLIFIISVLGIRWIHILLD